MKLIFLSLFFLLSQLSPEGPQQYDIGITTAPLAAPVLGTSNHKFTNRSSQTVIVRYDNVRQAAVPRNKSDICTERRPGDRVTYRVYAQNPDGSRGAELGSYRISVFAAACGVSWISWDGTKLD